jgi:hypothetical protein
VQAPPSPPDSLQTPATSAYVSIRQHTSAYVSIRQHTSAGTRSSAATRCSQETCANLLASRAEGSPTMAPSSHTMSAYVYIHRRRVELKAGLLLRPHRILFICIYPRILCMYIYTVGESSRGQGWAARREASLLQRPSRGGRREGSFPPPET